jgi:hypothetical protein
MRAALTFGEGGMPYSRRPRKIDKPGPPSYKPAEKNCGSCGLV